MRTKITSVAVVAVMLAGACSSPGATELRPVSAPISVGDRQLTVGEFEPLEASGVRGGRLTSIVPGTVEDVVAALLDFDEAAGHRSWAESFQTLDSGRDEVGTRVLVRWDFRGKLGVKPSVTIELRPERHRNRARVGFRMVEDAFGLRAFFGDIELRPVPGSPGSTLFTQRVFISSGLSFVGATHANLADGLREDARLLSLWLESRIRVGGTRTWTP